MPRLKRAQEHFTNREPHQKYFQKAFDQKTSKTPCVLSFNGVGGIGKTTLLERCERLLLEASRPYVKARINLETRSFHEPHRALIELRASLRRNHPKLEIPFTRFELGCTVYQRSVWPDIPIVENSLPWFSEGGEVANAIFSALNFTPLAFVSQIVKVMVNLKGPMERLIKERRFEEQLRQLHELADAHQHNKIPEKLIGFWAEDLRDYLTANPNTVPVIFIDTLEALWDGKEAGGQPRWDEWVRGLVNSLPEVLWVVFGRDELSWWKSPLPERHRLGDLSELDSRKFLASCGIPAGAVQDTVWAATQGHPFYLDLCVDTWLKVKETMEREPVPSDFAEKREEVVQRFKRYLSDKEVSTLEVLAVSNYWDKEIFRLLLPRSEFNEFNKKLGKQSYIHEREGIPGTWEMHALMRRCLLEEMDPEDRLEKSEVLFNYYDGLLKKIGILTGPAETEKGYFSEAFHHAKNIKNPNQLGEWFHVRGRSFKYYGLLIEMYEYLLNFQKDKAGENTLCVAITMKELGWMLSERGRAEESPKYFSESVNIMENIGEQGVLLADSKIKLAESMEFSVAEKLLKDSLRIYKKELGDRNNKVEEALQELVNLYKESDDEEEGEEEKYLKELLYVRKNLYGDQSKDVIDTLEDLGFAYSGEESIKYYKECIVAIENSESKELAHKLWYLYQNLGSACNRLDRIEDAMRYLEKAKEHLITESQCDPYLVGIKLNIADVLRKTGDLSNYVEILKSVFDNAKYEVGYFEDKFRAAGMLSKFFMEKNQYESAEKYLLFMLEYIAQRNADQKSYDENNVEIPKTNP